MFCSCFSSKRLSEEKSAICDLIDKTKQINLPFQYSQNPNETYLTSLFLPTDSIYQLLPALQGSFYIAGYLPDTSKYYTFICLEGADGLPLSLKTFSKNGKHINSEYPLIGKCHVIPCGKCFETLSISEKYNIKIIYSSIERKYDSLLNDCTDSIISSEIIHKTYKLNKKRELVLKKIVELDF